MVFKLIDLGNIATSRVGLSNYDGMVSPAYIILHNDSENNRFYFYYFLSMWQRQIFNSLGDNGVRSSLNANDLLNLPMVRVSDSERIKIADFLDEKCAKIDSLIAHEQATIEELKIYKQSVITEAVTKGLDKTAPMKDSGVEWIGQIPESWELSKLKYIGKFVKGPFGSAIKKSMFVIKADHTYKVYEQKNVIYKNMELGDYYITESDFNTLSTFEVKEGDVLISCAGTIGANYIVPTRFEKGIINQALMRVRLFNEIDKRLFVYIFLTILEQEIPKYSNGSAMKNIPPFDSLKNFFIPFPNLLEQRQIADYLDKKCADIDSLISIKQQKIEELKEYKKSLIYEYVTGKKEVA